MIVKTLFAIIIGFIVFISVDIRSEEKEEDKTIEVEVRGEIENPGIYELAVGADMEDLLEEIDLKENADTSQYSYQSRLYNKQLIIIPEKKEERLISINTADADELCKLPGIGIKTALKIIEYRNEYGGFRQLEDIKNVKGIGDAKYDRIKEHISL